MSGATRAKPSGASPLSPRATSLARVPVVAPSSTSPRWPATAASRAGSPGPRRARTDRARSGRVRGRRRRARRLRRLRARVFVVRAQDPPGCVPELVHPSWGASDRSRPDGGRQEHGARSTPTTGKIRRPSARLRERSGPAARLPPQAPPSALPRLDPASPTPTLPRAPRRPRLATGYSRLTGPGPRKIAWPPRRCVGLPRGRSPRHREARPPCGGASPAPPRPTVRTGPPGRTPAFRLRSCFWT